MTKHHDEWVKHPTGKIDKGKFCECCGRFNNRVSSCTMIGLKEGKVLMVFRKTNPQKGYWAFPGGYLDWDETIEECAVREFEEESGFKVKKVKFLGVYSNPNRDLDGRQNVNHCFYGEVVKEIGSIDDFEIEKVKWFNLNKLPQKIAFDHREMIGDYRKNNESFGRLRINKK